MLATTRMLVAALAAAMMCCAPGSLAATLNFTLVDTDLPNARTVFQEQFLGFHMAVMDARNHVDGLFPDFDVQLVDRTVTDDDPNNPFLIKQVVLGMEEDNSVAFMGGLLDGAFVVHSILQHDSVPQASFSPIKHLPTATEIRDFGANADMRALCRGLARLLLEGGINTVTLINTSAEETFLIYALFFELELPNFGVRVHQNLLLEEGGAEGVMDEALESDIRAFIVITSAPELTQLLLAGEARNMTQGGYAWLAYHTDGIQPYTVGPYSAYFPDLTRLVADTKLIGLTLGDVDASSPAVQAVVERARALPPIASVPTYNVTRDGITSVFATAYDTGMAMLRAVNRTIAAGGSPFDHEAVIAEMYNTNYDGLVGHLQFVEEGYGGLLHTMLFRQYSNPVTALGASFSNVMEYNALTDELLYSTVEWNTDDGLPPPNFSPESCGALFARSADGTCVPCAPGMHNDPTDGVEECGFCDDGSELQGEACVPCGANEESSRLESGQPVCKLRSDSSGADWPTVVGIVVGSVAGTAMLVIAATGGYRKVERTRTEIAQHRAKAKQAQFLGFSFHEMRNPLNVVSGALEFATETIRRLAKEEGNRAKDLGPVLKDLRCGQQSLVDTVHVLDTINMLSQIIHGVVSAEMQPTCPKELAKEVISLARQVRSSLVASEGEGQPATPEDEEGGSEGGEHSPRGPEVALDAVVRLDGVEIKSRDFFVAMDRQKMRQALLILLINALKYTVKGRVVVHIDLERQRQNTARNHHHHHPSDNNEPVVVRMCVCDTGTGMPSEDLAHVFDLDYQTERGSVRSTGLGLVLAHRIVAMHGGELKVRSVHASNAEAQGESTGTRFTWSLSTFLLHSGAKPRASPQSSAHGNEEAATELDVLPHGNAQKQQGQGQEAQQQQQQQEQQEHEQQQKPKKVIAQPVALFGREMSSLVEPRTPHTKAGSNTTNTSAGNIAEMLRTMPAKLRVLLMEDVKLNRTFMRRKLTTYPFNELGWVVEEVETGEKCLDLIVDQGEQFDVVFCDQILSNAGGKLLGNEVAIKLREHERVTNAEKRMVLIACSGNASDEDRKLYAESGMDGVVAKPLPPQNALFKFLHPLLAHGD